MALCTMNGQAGLQTQVHIYNGTLTHTAAVHTQTQ